MTKHKVFISYHHTNDQWAKEALLKCNEENGIFIDGSVDTGGILVMIYLMKKLER